MLVKIISILAAFAMAATANSIDCPYDINKPFGEQLDACTTEITKIVKTRINIQKISPDAGKMTLTFSEVKEVAADKWTEIKPAAETNANLMKDRAKQLFAYMNNRN